MIQVKVGPLDIPHSRQMSEHLESAFDVVAIGGSAGSIEAVRRLLAALPTDLRAAVILCFHRPVERESLLAAVLGRAGCLPVLTPEHGEVLQRGVCYLGHPRTHLVVGPGLVAQFVHDGFYRAHNIDLLFSSLARNAGPRTIGVLLSGLAKDGVEGLRAIKEAGGKALVQSPSDALFDTLPMNALAHDGPVDLVAPVRDLAAEIVRLTGSPQIGSPGDSAPTVVLPQAVGQP